jgi:outer membrane lipopolysaccharide assembly protein LptE/RlpB
VIFLCICLAGCGYRFAGQADGLHSLRGKSVAIPLFNSKAYRPGLETLLTQSVIDEFARRSGGRVVTEAAGAELLLLGTVTSYTSRPVSYTTSDRIAEYRAELAISAELRDRTGGKILWQGNLAEYQDYPVETDIALQLNREKAAVREVCRKLAERLYIKAGEDF